MYCMAGRRRSGYGCFGCVGRFWRIVALPINRWASLNTYHISSCWVNYYISISFRTRGSGIRPPGQITGHPHRSRQIYLFTATVAHDEAARFTGQGTEVDRKSHGEVLLQASDNNWHLFIVYRETNKEKRHLPKNAIRKFLYILNCYIVFFIGTNLASSPRKIDGYSREGEYLRNGKMKLL